MIGSILNLMGPDVMLVLLIVPLLFGAKKLPELARGKGRAVKEFGAARDEIEKGLNQTDPNGEAQVKELDTERERPCNGMSRDSSECSATNCVLGPIAVEAQAALAS